MNFCNSRKIVVRGGGLEPPQCCHRQDLNLVRLPISPPARVKVHISHIEDIAEKSVTQDFNPVHGLPELASCEIWAQLHACHHTSPESIVI
jgi:hypothetical protein